MIKNIDERIIAEGFHTGHEVDVVTIQKSDYEQLKEQAERVQELEKELKSAEMSTDIAYLMRGSTFEDNLRLQIKNDRLAKQNKRYREAIGEIRELLRGRTDSFLQDEVDEIIKELEGDSE